MEVLSQAMMGADPQSLQNEGFTEKANHKQKIGDMCSFSNLIEYTSNTGLN